MLKLNNKLWLKDFILTFTSLKSKPKKQINERLRLEKSFRPTLLHTF
jgi:hypothetical protein